MLEGQQGNDDDDGPDRQEDRLGTNLGDEALGATIHIMIAGLDTVSSMLGFVMIFLAQNPEHRRALIDDPALISRAVNEISRRFPTVTMVRQVRTDIDYLGVTMKKRRHYRAPWRLL